MLRITDNSPISILPPPDEPLTAPTPPEIYTWTFPGSPVHIHLRLDAVAGEQQRLKQTPSAQGGLLLGHPVRPGTIEITGFHPLPKLDAETIKSALPKLSGQVTGFYRMTNGSLLLDDADRKLAEEQFRDPSSVALVIGSAASGVSQACFFFRLGGMLQADLPVMVFPFDRERLSSSEQQRRSRAPEPAASSEPPTVSEEVERDPAVPAPRKRRRGYRIVGLMAVVIAGASTGYLFGTGRLASLPEQLGLSALAPVPVDLQFRADTQPDGLLFSWNGRSSAITSARYGMLLLRGAGVSLDVPLTADQLRTGVKLYTPDPPLSGRVALEFNVIDGDRVIRESANVSVP